MRFCLFGAGRIGAIHAGNVQRRRDCDLVYVVDVIDAAARNLADLHGAKVVSVGEALSDDAIDAVIIGSSTDTHADLIEASARAGKAIFCEKPIDLSLARVDACLKVVEEEKAALFVGFNRRFDPTFAALKSRLDNGEIGDLEQLIITSRDPGLPPMDYLKVSGGVFRDMMIHDFDMARWILGEEPAEIYVAAGVLVDPALNDIGDVDSAMTTLKTGSGKMVQINVSRRAAYGYDQRIEALGGKGMLRAGNQAPDSLEVSSVSGTTRGNPQPFFLERYQDAYRIELNAFIDAVRNGDDLNPGGTDGREALRMADAALTSHQTGLPVKL